MEAFSKVLVLGLFFTGISYVNGQGVCSCICKGNGGEFAMPAEGGDGGYQLEGDGGYPPAGEGGYPQEGDENYNPGDDDLAPRTLLTAAALIQLAKDLLAPFTKTALERLHSAVFGKGRANRSTDIALHNPSNVEFTIDSNSCKSGGWTATMFPPHKIAAKASEIFGAESTALGVDCSVKYYSKDRSKWISMTVKNPLAGKNDAFVDAVGVKKSKIFSVGNSNTVRFTFENI